MSNPRSIAVAAVILLSLSACKRTPAPATNAPADAGATITAANAAPADAAAPEEPPIPTDKTLRPVAVVHGAVEAFKSADGRVFFASGPLVYEGKRDGTLVPLVEPSELTPFVPDDEVLTGYRAPMAEVTRVTVDPKGTLRLFSGADAKQYLLDAGKLRAIEGGKASARVASFDGHLLGIVTEKETTTLAGVSEGAKVPALPAGHTAIDLTSANDGSLAVLAKDGKKMSLALFANHKYDEPRVIAFERPALGATTSCEFVRPALDGHLTIRCASAAWESGTVKAAYLRLANDTFEKMYEGAPADVSSAAIAKDGTLFTTASNKLEVSRCPEHGKCEKVTVEKPVAKKRGTPGPEEASYTWLDTDALERDGNRYWTALRIETEKQDAFDYSATTEIVAAKSETDVWMTARYANQTVLFHTNPERERVRLPSRVDARVMVRNTKAPQPWTGHCDAVFVRVDPDVIDKRKKEVQPMLGFAASEDDYYGPPFGFEIVEGRLHDAKVTGVLVHRNDVEANLATMEAAVDRLVNKLAVNPMNRPTVTCTLPVLTAKIGP